MHHLITIDIDNDGIRGFSPVGSLIAHIRLAAVGYRPLLRPITGVEPTRTGPLTHQRVFPPVREWFVVNERYAAKDAGVKRARVEMRRDMPPVTEWFEIDGGYLPGMVFGGHGVAAGLIHTIMLRHALPRPEHAASISFALDFGPHLSVCLDGAGGAYVLTGLFGVSYRCPVAWDRRGKLLNTRLSTEGCRLFLEVEDREAWYPVTLRSATRPDEDDGPWRAGASGYGAA